MPLHFPDHHKPERLDAHGGNLRLRDNMGRVVQLYVHIGAMHRIGNAAGIDGNVIDKDVHAHLYLLLDSILVESGQFYDAQPEPKPQKLEIDRNYMGVARWLKQ